MVARWVCARECLFDLEMAQKCLPSAHEVPVLGQTAVPRQKVHTDFLACLGAGVYFAPGRFERHPRDGRLGTYHRR
jgi:hypothetical protein